MIIVFAPGITSSVVITDFRSTQIPFFIGVTNDAPDILDKLVLSLSLLIFLGVVKIRFKIKKS